MMPFHLLPPEPPCIVAAQPARPVLREAAARALPVLAEDRAAGAGRFRRTTPPAAGSPGGPGRAAERARAAGPARPAGPWAPGWPCTHPRMILTPAPPSADGAVPPVRWDEPRLTAGIAVQHSRRGPCYGTTCATAALVHGDLLPGARGQIYRRCLSECETRASCRYARIEAAKSWTRSRNEESWAGRTAHRHRCLG
jgi:hypothetical protein